jgi:hypothetical protein
MKTSCAATLALAVPTVFGVEATAADPLPLDPTVVIIGNDLSGPPILTHAAYDATLAGSAVAVGDFDGADSRTSRSATPTRT